jgi:hypothetical protein
MRSRHTAMIPSRANIAEKCLGNMGFRLILSRTGPPGTKRGGRVRTQN